MCKYARYVVIVFCCVVGVRNVSKRMRVVPQDIEARHRVMNVWWYKSTKKRDRKEREVDNKECVYETEGVWGNQKKNQNPDDWLWWQVNWVTRTVQRRGFANAKVCRTRVL